MKKLWAIPITFILVLIDYYTKYLTRIHLADSSIVLIDGVFELTFVKNTGAAFGLLKDKKWFFIAITIVFIAFAIAIIIKLNSNKRYIPFALSIIFLTSGAIGNFIDRLTLGYVTDMLYFKLIDFPVFNVADCYITCSVVFLAILILFVYKEDEPLFSKKDS